MSIKKPVADAATDAKKRECLACQTSFDSAWAGERICPKCKGSSAWRSGSGRPQAPGRAEPAERASVKGRATPHP